MSNLKGLIPDIDIEERNPNYPLCINISYEELRKEDIMKVLLKLQYLNNTEKGKMQNRIVFRFYGYPPEDGKELFEIKLVREWVQKLYQHMPHLFYFLSEDFGCARNTFLCLASINRKAYIGEEIDIDFFKEETKPLVSQICHKAIAFGQQENRDGLEELKNALQRILKPFQTI